jgi:polysaccharide biosynthesis protein PslJ
LRLPIPQPDRQLLTSPLAIALLAVLLGILAGASVSVVPFYFAFAGLLALLAGLLMLRSVEVCLVAVLAVATLLPFGTLPFKAVVTPTFLSLAQLALLGVLTLRLLTRPEERLELTALGLPLIGFLGLTFFSFIWGARGSPDSLTLHNYFKFVLSVLFFFSVVNTLRTRGQARRMLQALMLGGAFAALLGLALYALNDASALRILVALSRIGYPAEGRVLRYVEDDPAGLERAIGFSVDPNSFGGMLALVCALTTTQVLAARPVLPRWLLVAMAGAMALALFLTYSRAALGGLIVAAMYVATLRYRRLWWVILAGGAFAAVLLVGLGLGQQFSERIIEGVQFQDQANQMRLAEYRNAIEVIRNYPYFGIGFGRAPELDLVAGVSSIYLAIAQRTGLIGLAAFLGIVGLFFVRSVAALGGVDEERASWLVGLQAGIAAALAVGLLDHYFFNIEFAHMVALFWGTIGLALAVARLPQAESSA